MAEFKARTDKQVAIFCADGLEECEALVTRDVLWRAGVPVTTVSLTSDTAVASSRGVTFDADTTIARLDWDAYDMLVLPGGMPGTKVLAACQPLCDHLVSFVKEGRCVSAVCAAPSVLAELGLLEGRHATANPNFQHVLAEHGATVEPDSPVVVDGTITTSQGLGTSIAFGLALAERYVGKEVAEETSKKIVVL